MLKIPEPEIVADLQGCFVVNKPGGLLTQGPPGIDSLELRIKNFIKQHRQMTKTGKVYLGVPHRLDRPASGIMLFAKNPRAAKRLACQFQERLVSKKYWAVVEGCVPEEQASWVDYMRKLPDQAKSEICDHDHPDAQVAKLHYQVVDRNEERSWLEIQLETGRTHQIRLQSSHRGYPIVGDALYGADSYFGPHTPDSRQRWIALHAREIGFEEPMTSDPMHFTAAISKYWHQLPFSFLPTDSG